MRPGRTITGVVIMLTLFSMSFSAPSGAVVEQQARRSAASYAQTAFDVTNNQRVKFNRSRLAKSTCLREYAAKQARKMANQQRLFHQDLAAIQRECNVGWVGENVAMGYPSGRAVVLQGWMKSEGHRENILSRHFRKMGLAASLGDDGAWYTAQVFGRAM